MHRLKRHYNILRFKPVLITLPETSYLKGFTCQVIATR